MRNITNQTEHAAGGWQGGIAHALYGTLMITLIASVIAIPLGLMTAIFLVEYGRGSWLARTVTLLVDVMTGIPSIVAGLFASALFLLVFGPQSLSAITGAIALALLMTPTVVRSAEEMLRLVPADLREASYALGVPRWRTIVKVVLPTAIGGIVTGITLAIARVIGETAPLLVTVGYAASFNGNIFHNAMGTLPTFIQNQYAQPDLFQPPLGQTGVVNYSTPRMWAAVLVLIIIVMILNLVARVIGRIYAPKTGR
jgi:phosphate transport system permease protein